MKGSKGDGDKKPKKGAEVKRQYATAIPIGTAIAQSRNTELAELCGDIVGDEMERFGVQLWLAPALNIHRDQRCGRNFEYFSEDPLISGAFAAAITKGVQRHPGCGTTIKHFAANNQETNRYNYNLLNGVHTSERRDLIEDILRAEFGFEGIVMTDWVVDGGTMNKKSIHPAPRARKVAAAGGDLYMPGGKADYKNILSALKTGKLTRRQLEINATRVVRMADRLNQK